MGQVFPKIIIKKKVFKCVPLKNTPALFWPSAVFSCEGWMATAAYNGHPWILKHCESGASAQYKKLSNLPE